MAPSRNPILPGLVLALVLCAACAEPPGPEPSAETAPQTPQSPSLAPPTLLWERVLTGPGVDWGQDLSATSDGGLVVAGHSDPDDDGRFDARIVRLDSGGELVWDRSYGGPRRDLASSVRETADGGFVVAGLTRSGGEAENKGWILRLDSRGELVWERRLGGTGSDWLYSAIETSAGSIVGVGYTTSIGAGNEDLWLVALAPDGELLWERAFGEELSDWGYGVAEGKDGLRVVGAAARDGVPDLDGCLLAFSLDGELLWDKDLGRGGPDELLGLAVLPGGDFAVAGYSQPDPSVRTQFRVLRVAEDGTVRWDRSLGGAGDDMAMAIAATGEGRIFVTGGTTPEGSSAPDVWTIALSSDGDWLWQDRRGGPQPDVAQGVAVLSGGAVAVAGYLRPEPGVDPELWIFALSGP